MSSSRSSGIATIASQTPNSRLNQGVSTSLKYAQGWTRSHPVVKAPPPGEGSDRFEDNSSSRVPSQNTHSLDGKQESSRGRSRFSSFVRDAEEMKGRPIAPALSSASVSSTPGSRRGEMFISQSPSPHQNHSMNPGTGVPSALGDELRRIATSSTPLLGHHGTSTRAPGLPNIVDFGPIEPG